MKRVLHLAILIAGMGFAASTPAQARTVVFAALRRRRAADPA